MIDEAETTEKPARRRHCEHGAPLGACDVEDCPDRALHRCLTNPCLVVGCENSRPAPLPPEEAFELGLRQVRAEERANPNPADFPPDAVTAWEETQRLAARESSSSALPGALVGFDENGRVAGKTEPWEFRPPQAHADLHHDEAMVLGTGSGARLFWRQSTPMHTSGARYTKKSPRSRVHLITETEAAEEIAERERAAHGQLSVLSTVEREILDRDARGESRSKIAWALKLTERQVKRHLEKARAKVRVHATSQRAGASR